MIALAKGYTHRRAVGPVEEIPEPRKLLPTNLGAVIEFQLSGHLVQGVRVPGKWWDVNEANVGIEFGWIKSEDIPSDFTILHEGWDGRR